MLHAMHGCISPGLPNLYSSLGSSLFLCFTSEILPFPGIPTPAEHIKAPWNKLRGFIAFLQTSDQGLLHCCDKTILHGIPLVLYQYLFLQTHLFLTFVLAAEQGWRQF